MGKIKAITQVELLNEILERIEKLESFKRVTNGRLESLEVKDERERDPEPNH